MATSPTVLANSSSSTSPGAPVVAETPRFPVVPILLVVLASVAVALLLAGGGAYYLVRSGRLPMPGMVTRKAEVVVPPAMHVMELEPLLVNLADGGGSSYLRVAIALRVMDAPEKGGAAKGEKAKEDKSLNEAVAPVRDTLLTVLGRQTADELLAADGKERLKAALKTALTEHNPEMKVTEVFFTDFLVQR